MECCPEESYREMKASDGSTALHLAASENYIECAEVLLEGCRINHLYMEDIYGRTAIGWAEVSGERLFKIFREKIKDQRNQENTYNPHKDKKLVELKTIKNCVQSIKENKIEELEEILQKCPTVLKQRLSAARWNLLHYAIANKHGKFVECILKLANAKGFSSYLNTRTFNGDTALIVAVRSESVEIVKIVLKYCDKKNLLQRDQKNKTPIKIATARRNRQIKKLLKEKAATFLNLTTKMKMKNSLMRIYHFYQENCITERKMIRVLGL
eukprot:TRINITY_DN878_c0_g4_i1.p1 TRINITY_DN878_c0_g4~~TRINITY_DN878_c0_g4_i1.p1  ORF type:complete len:269 (-),score=12.57 TRINITY_DN878_c0_g4_i1:98-904(-)